MVVWETLNHLHEMSSREITSESSDEDFCEKLNLVTCFQQRQNGGLRVTSPLEESRQDLRYYYDLASSFSFCSTYKFQLWKVGSNDILLDKKIKQRSRILNKRAINIIKAELKKFGVSYYARNYLFYTTLTASLREHEGKFGNSEKNV